MKRALLLVGVLALSATACSEDVPTGLAPNAVVVLAAPANDDFDGAVEVTGIPFSYTESVGEATVAKDDPIGKKGAQDDCFGDAQTLWFKFTATESARLTANTIGSNYDTELLLLTGTRRHLTVLDCNDELPGGGPPDNSSLTFDAVAGQTYYFMVAQTGIFVQPTDQLVFNLVPVVQVGITIDGGEINPGQQTGKITGTATCSRRAFVELNLLATQGQAIGDYFAGFNCDGVTPFEAELIVVEGGRFTVGPAEVTGGALFYASSGELIHTPVSATVQLRGGS
jgi:hypothetical protein